MKTKSITIASFLMICLLMLTSVTTLQDSKTIEVIYDNNEDNSCTFVGINAENEEYMITFHEIEESALKSYNLKSNKLFGAKFSVTYTTKTETENDDKAETNTIIALKKR